MTHAAPLRLSRRLAASPEAVYAAWTNAEFLARWLIPIPGGHAESVVDARVGGRYTIDMYTPAGQKLPHTGEYLRLEPHSLVEFTWVSHATQPALNSVVTVDLRPVGNNETQLTLTHSLLPNEASVADHQGGWSTGLERLAAFVRLPADRRGKNYRSTFVMDAPLSKVFQAITTTDGLRAWWTPTCETGSAVGEPARFQFGSSHKHMVIDRLMPDRELRWLCTEAFIDMPGLKRQGEWVNTTIVFRIMAETPQSTRLYFEHIGLTEELECWQLCNAGWAQFLGSLKRYVETGVGAPWTEHPKVAA